MIPLTSEQLQALQRFAQHHGRSWKERVRTLWSQSNPRTDDEAIVYALRNTHGPRWLTRFRIAAQEMMMTSQRLDAFTRQYIETALWSTMDQSDEQGGEPLDKNYSIDDIAPETMELIVEDCADFQEKYWRLLSDSGIDDERAGHDFWLSRNGHGTGFFDEDTIDDEFQDQLQDAAEAYGEFDLYVGDDGLIYGPPPEWHRKHRHVGEIRRRAPLRRHLRQPDDDPETETDIQDMINSNVAIGDARGGGYSISWEGRYWTRTSDWDEALRLIAERMEKEQFWPELFFVNERGNTDLLRFSYRKSKTGKITHVKTEIIKSWV